MSGVDVVTTDGGVLISEPQGAVHHAYNMIRLNTMRRQIQRMLSDKVGSLLSTATGEVVYITDCPSIVVRWMARWPLSIRERSRRMRSTCYDPGAL